MIPIEQLGQEDRLRVRVVRLWFIRGEKNKESLCSLKNSAIWFGASVEVFGPPSQVRPRLIRKAFNPPIIHLYSLSPSSITPCS